MAALVRHCLTHATPVHTAPLSARTERTYELPDRRSMGHVPPLPDAAGWRGLSCFLLESRNGAHRVRMQRRECEQQRTTVAQPCARLVCDRVNALAAGTGAACMLCAGIQVAAMRAHAWPSPLINPTTSEHDASVQHDAARASVQRESSLFEQRCRPKLTTRLHARALLSMRADCNKMVPTIAVKRG